MADASIAVASAKEKEQGKARAKRNAKLRLLLRAIHRDAGYLAVGLTFVYALSGLAVNHVKDWDPSFTESSRLVHVDAPLDGDDDDAIAKTVMTALDVHDKPRDVYRAAPDQLEIVFDKRTLHVDTAKHEVLDEGQKPRFLLRAANWLHLNRGKKAWTYVADTYAAALLFLSISGLFMIPGKKGLIGRGAILAAIGVAIPIAYVQLSGGPEAASGAPKTRR